MRWLVLTFLGVFTLLTGSGLAAQSSRSRHGLVVSVTHTERNQYGILINVEIVNASERKLFLPQEQVWHPNIGLYFRVASLEVEQWSDGKTNLLPEGSTLTTLQKTGYFSVGTCNDAPFEGRWIQLNPGDHLSDQVQAFEPDQVDFVPSSCTWRHAHLLGPLRVSVKAFPAPHFKLHNSVTGLASFPVPQQADFAPGPLAPTQAAPDATRLPNHIQITATIAEKMLLQNVEVCYPTAVAYTSRVIGTVVVAIEIDKNGNVIHPSIVSGPAPLRKSVLDAVENHYKYKPYLLNGRAVNVETTVSVFVGRECHSSTPYWVH
jgi:hypothetical protein